MRQAFAPWTPVAFCAFISFLALIAQIGPDTAWWKPTFYCFLPMCFYYVGALIVDLQRELRDLRERLAQLEQQRSR